jgi:hypothetical protein
MAQVNNGSLSSIPSFLLYPITIPLALLIYIYEKVGKPLLKKLTILRLDDNLTVKGLGEPARRQATRNFLRTLRNDYDYDDHQGREEGWLTKPDQNPSHTPNNSVNSRLLATSFTTALTFVHTSPPLISPSAVPTSNNLPTISPSSMSPKPLLVMIHSPLSPTSGYVLPLLTTNVSPALQESLERNDAYAFVLDACSCPEAKGVMSLLGVKKLPWIGVLSTVGATGVDRVRVISSSSSRSTAGDSSPSSSSATIFNALLDEVLLSLKPSTPLSSRGDVSAQPEAPGLVVADLEDVIPGEVVAGGRLDVPVGAHKLSKFFRDSSKLGPANRGEARGEASFSSSSSSSSNQIRLSPDQLTDQARFNSVVSANLSAFLDIATQTFALRERHLKVGRRRFQATETTRLREEQDREFNDARALDKKKSDKKEEELQASMKAEREAAMKDAKEKEIGEMGAAIKRSRVESQLAVAESGEFALVPLQILFPSGRKIIVKTLTTNSKVRDLFDFVDVTLSDLPEGAADRGIVNYEINLRFPRKVVGRSTEFEIGADGGENNEGSSLVEAVGGSGGGVVMVCDLDS